MCDTCPGDGLEVVDVQHVARLIYSWKHVDRSQRVSKCASKWAWFGFMWVWVRACRPMCFSCPDVGLSVFFTGCNSAYGL